MHSPTISIVGSRRKRTERLARASGSSSTTSTRIVGSRSIPLTIRYERELIPIPSHRRAPDSAYSRRRYFHKAFADASAYWRCLSLMDYCRRPEGAGDHHCKHSESELHSNEPRSPESNHPVPASRCHVLSHFPRWAAERKWEH